MIWLALLNACVGGFNLGLYVWKRQQQSLIAAVVSIVVAILVATWVIA